MRIILIILTIPLLLLLILQLYFTQNFIKNLTVNYLQKKLHTKLAIQQLHFSWFSDLQLKGVYLEDQQHDTLLYSGELNVHYDLLRLLEHSLVIHDLQWENVTAYIYRNKKDTAFNYQFIIHAFGNNNNKSSINKSGKHFSYAIDTIQLKQFNIQYRDMAGGMQAKISFDSVALLPDEILPDSMRFTLHQLLMNKLQANIIIQSSSLPKSKSLPVNTAATTTTVLPFVSCNDISINKTNIFFHDQENNFATIDSIGRLHTTKLALQLQNNRINTDSLLVANTKANIQLGASNIKVTKDTSSNSSTPFHIDAKQINFYQNNFRLDNNAAPASHYTNAIDYNHLRIDSLQANISNARYDAATLLAIVKNISMKEKSGFELKQFHSVIHYSPSELLLDSLLLVTNNSRIGNTLEVRAPSWSTISQQLNKLQLKLNLQHTHIDAAEALYFDPALKNNTSLQPMLHKQIDLTANLHGSLENIAVGDFNFADQDGNKLIFNGHILNATDVNKILVDVDIKQLASGNRALRSWLAPGVLNNNIQLPTSINISGPVKASKQILQTHLHIRSSDGNIELASDLRQYLDSLHAQYNISIKSSPLPVGKITGDTSLGTIALNGKISGKGWAPRSMLAKANLNIPVIGYDHYNYHHISLVGAVSKQYYHIQFQSKDTAANIHLQLQGNPDPNQFTAAGFINIKKMDLHALHFSASPFSFSNNIRLQLNDLAPYHLDGWIHIDSTVLAMNSKRINIDTIRISATDSSNQQYILLQAPFADIHANGHFNYTTIAKPVSHIIAYHLQPADSALAADTFHTHQTLWLKASFSWPDNLRSLLPGFSLSQPVTFTTHINTDSFLVAGQVHIPELKYANYQVDSLRSNFNIDQDSLYFATSLQRLLHPDFPLGKTALYTTAQHGIINATLYLSDKQQKPKYEIGAQLKSGNDRTYQFTLHHRLLLNGELWKIPTNNNIIIHHGRLQQADFSLTRKDEKLLIKTIQDNHYNVPDVQMNFTNFDLAPFTTLFASDTPIVAGTVNGNIAVKNWHQSPLLHASLQIDSLQILDAPLGDLALQASNSEPNNYSVKLHITGHGNDVLLNGTYHARDNNPFDFMLQLQPLQLAHLEPLTFGSVSQLSGNVDGKLTVKGNASQPLVTGMLHFNNAGFDPTIINSHFTLKNEAIHFENDGVHFKDFTLTDSAGNQAVLDGDILTNNYRYFTFRLQLATNNFKVLGGRQSSRQWFYGPAYIDSRTTIHGNTTLPRISTHIKLHDKSQVTVIIPQPEPGIANREGVVEFISKNAPTDTLVHTIDTTVFVNKKLSGLAFSGDIEITPASMLKIIIDQQNGDNLQIKGNADLVTTLDPGGKFSLTGQYEISEGKYEMSLNQLIKRSFNIQKGSTITWQGDPTKAKVDITAMYTTYTSAAGLVQDQLANASASTRTMYQQKLPIEVMLYIKGDMLKPDISFKLDMPAADQNDLGGAVYTRLKQINQIPDELNKQVMGLLVLNSFIPENPADLFNNGGGSLQNTARKSVSKIVSQQLNNLAGNLIKGFDVNFDLQSGEDYSTGTAQESTSLNVGVSKSLLNDRLSVSVGNNFALEGNPQQASGLAGDVAIQYLLTKDGRYRVKAYRKNLTQEVIQGQIVETGVTFSLVMDYNKFKEIFEKAKEEKFAQQHHQHKKK